MAAAGVYALRYTPALVLVVLAPIVLHIRLKYFRPCEWHGLWWLVLTLYTPLLHTSFSLLDCPTLDGEQTFTPRWYINANVRCFQDAEHAPLGLFALFVVVFCLSLVPFVFLVATKKLSRPYWVHCLVGALTAPYKPKLEWWCAVELVKRVFLVLFAVAFKPNDISVLFILVLTLALTGFFKPYKKMLVNVLDIAFAVDIFVLLTLRTTVDIEDETSNLPEQDPSSIRTCSDIQGFSTFVLLLSPLYYLPLFLAALAGGVWGVWHLYHLVRNHWTRMKSISRQESEPFPPPVAPSRPRTQTVVDLGEYEGTSHQHQQRKGSFNIRRLSRKKKSVKKTESSRSSTRGGEGEGTIALHPVARRRDKGKGCGGDSTSALINSTKKAVRDEKDYSVTIRTTVV